jgi:hypothetical protein
MSRRLRWSGRFVLLLGLAMFVLLPAAAGAGEGDSYVPSTTVTTDPCDYPTDPAVCGTGVAAQASAELPFTGGSAALLTVVGLVVAGAGIALVMLGRRSASSSASS